MQAPRYVRKPPRPTHPELSGTYLSLSQIVSNKMPVHDLSTGETRVQGQENPWDHASKHGVYGSLHAKHASWISFL